MQVSRHRHQMQVSRHRHQMQVSVTEISWLSACGRTFIFRWLFIADSGCKKWPVSVSYNRFDKSVSADFGHTVFA
jgi:hypothetical protein